MKVTGIIAEYNPFHKGHAYHAAEARKLTGADHVIAVMSGDFVQRGEPALIDKYTRARMALENGVDLVLELPTAYALSSAEGFASGAVSTLDGLGIVDALCFGSECGSISLLDSYAQVLAEEPVYYRDLLKTLLSSGESFPLARSKALSEYFSYTRDILPCAAEDRAFTPASDPLSSPNNSLGIEYLKALRLHGSKITPYTIERRSEGYHSLSMEGEMASASAIRKALMSGPYTADTSAGKASSVSETPAEDGNAAISAALLSQLPENARDIFSEEVQTNGILTLQDLSMLMRYKLTGQSAESLSAYADLSPEMANRILAHLYEYTDLVSFTDLIKTKQITHTRVTRALMHVLTGDLQTDAVLRKEQNYPTYARVLGFRKDSKDLLTAISKNASIPLITSPVDFEEKLGETEQKMFRQDLDAARLYETVRAEKYHRKAINELTMKMLVI